MDEIVFEILKCAVMVATLVVVRYVIPWVKSIIEASNLDIIATWVMNAVLKAQQVFTTYTGAEKKAVVVSFLTDLLNEKGISITDDQLDTLIEAAVKEMKIQENEVPKDDGNTSGE